MTSSKRARFPLGDAVALDELETDPYPVFARLREHEPISWIRALDMWYVVGYEDVRAALLDTSRLTTASPHSTIFDTFGAHMLTTEGEAHDRYRNATKRAFTPNFIRTHLEPSIGACAARLVRGFAERGEVELREAFASRLPIQVMLMLCGLPAEDEMRMRRWYDSFEAALANFTNDATIRENARRSVGEFHGLLGSAIASIRPGLDDSLLAQLVNAPAADRLSDEEIKRNLSIIFFGGISSVEALLLNCLWALFENPGALEHVRASFAAIPPAIEETLRWLSPVQSATRHATRCFEWHGVEIAAHDTVNCMLGAANRDRSVFADPDTFDLNRPNSRRHLGFATGIHACLGSHLAKAEVRIGLETLLDGLPRLRRVDSSSKPPTGYEFRQSRKLTVSWDPPAQKSR